MTKTKPESTLIRSPAVVVRADATIAEAVARMKAAEVGAVLVIADDGSDEIVGIFTERDLLRKVDLVRTGGHWDKPVRTVMSRPVRTIELADLESAADLMLEMNVRHLPVVRSSKGPGRNELLGVLSMRDLFRAEVKRRQDEELRGILDVTVGSELSGEILVIEARPRLALVLKEAFARFPESVIVQPDRPSAAFATEKGLGRLAEAAAIVVDIDEQAPAAWKAFLKALNQAKDMPKVFIAFDRETQSAEDQEMLFKLSRSRQFTSLVKPVNVSALLLQLTPLLMK